MIVNSTTKRGIDLKNKVLENIDALYGKEEIEDIALVSKCEGFYLWDILLSNHTKCNIYSNRDGKLLFDGNIFACASPFSSGCAWVKVEDTWFILNTLKNECVGIPNQITWKNIRPIKNGNIALFNPKNVWGSIYYDSEEHTFKKDIPFIWDALEFSEHANEVIVGMCHEKDNNYQMKLTNMKKEEAYQYESYKKFLKEQYKLQKECLMLAYATSELTKTEFCMSAYPFYETKEVICTNKQPESVETVPTSEYKRVLGRAVK